MAAKKVVVVGAGPGGLASAMLLAAAGLDVTVLERLPRVGGRTSTLEGNGHRFDVGPTFFLFPQVLAGIFEACGRSLEDEIELVRLDPHYRLVFEDGASITATPDVDRLEREIAALCPSDARGVRPWLQDNRRKLEAFRPILESPFLSVTDLLSLPLRDVLPLVRPFSSVDDDLRRHFSDPRVRLAFSFQSKYLGMSPFRCPSLFTILSFIEYEHGVFHPRGGCGAVSETMARVARELGATFRLGEAVTGIEFRGKRAVAVRTERGVHPCDALVVNADFAQAMRTLVPDALRRRWRDRRIEKARYSCSTFMMYLGLEGRVELPHHTIWLASDYVENLADIETRHVLTKNPSFYVQNPTVTDPDLAPQGCSSLYVLLPVTHEHPNVDWSRETPAFRRLALRQLERLGVTDVEKRLRFEKILTPSGWASELGIYRGATFNLAHDLGQMLHLRPRNRFEDLEGVYLTGGGTHPGSGLPVIYESAKISARLLAEDLGVHLPELPGHGRARSRSRGHEARPERPEAAARQLLPGASAT